MLTPALINGLSIPLLKNWLGAPAYGRYALYFNALLLCNLLLSGWLSQSLLRFHARAASPAAFNNQVFRYAVACSSLAFVPATAVLWWQSGRFFTGLLFGASLWLTAILSPLQAITQANFLSKTTVYAEAIRTISWMGSCALFLYLGLPFLPALFAALAFSYLLSVLFLCHQNRIRPGFGRPQTGMEPQLLKTLLKYGWPFSLWFMLFYLIGYVDKLLYLKHFGAAAQGHYSALFDFTARGLTLLLAPVITAIMPLLADSYEKGDQHRIRVLLRKLLLLELLAFLVIVSGYWLGGYRLLFFFLRIPATSVNQQTGLLFIAGTLLWQMGLLMHKPLELQLQTVRLFFKILVALLVQLGLYYGFRRMAWPLLYPVGYCLAAFVYCLLVFASLFRRRPTPAVRTINGQ